MALTLQRRYLSGCGSRPFAAAAPTSEVAGVLTWEGAAAASPSMPASRLFPATVRGNVWGLHGARRAALQAAQAGAGSGGSRRLVWSLERLGGTRDPWGEDRPAAEAERT